MAVKTLDEYKQMMQQQLDPLYQSKGQNLTAGVNTQLANYDTQSNTTNRNYDNQLGNLKVSNADDLNGYSNNVLGRNLARSSIAVTGLEGVKGRGQMRVDNLESNRQGDLGNIESQRAALKNSLQTQLSALDSEKLAQIISGAQNLYNTDYQRDYETQQAEQAYQRQLEQNRLQQEYQAAEAEKARQFEAQQNALSRAASATKSSSSNSSASAKAQQQSSQNALYATFNDMFNNGQADTWLQNNGSQIMRDFGSSVYYDMVDKLNKYQSQFKTNQRTNYQDQKDNQANGYYVTNGGRMLIE